jgi:hypothetical protein
MAKSNITYKIENDILIIHFQNINKMNEIMDPLSNEYEGIMNNRIGHNFPSDYIPNNHKLFGQLKNQCKYVIAYNSLNDLSHELLHAKYYLDQKYKKQINDEWDSLKKNKKEYITNLLKKLGYSDKVIIDEYQAYKYSEKKSFF